jgi:pimeloyl-ACP methyl ester carboxylesterase
VKQDALAKFVLATIILLVPRTVLSQNLAPLSIAQEGYVYAGGKYSTVNGRQVMSGQLYAEYQIPTQLLHPYPIVMVPGAGSSGATFMGTPDGREGWAQFFLRQGYAVYVIDQPGRGRGAYVSDVYGPLSPVESSEALQRRLTRPEEYNLWPQAHLHSQWPGAGKPGDSSFDTFMASRLPVISDFTLQQVLNRDAIIALLTKIGPAILLTHSQSGAFGWSVADARPDLVKAIVAVEPSGPPFYDVQDVGAPQWFQYGTVLARPWGITADPLTYSPPAESASHLQIVQQERPDSPELCRCWLQKDPARQLPNLKEIPILVVTSESSYHAPYDHCTVNFLEQAGVHPTWIKLTQIGIHGNGHGMMLEKNNMEIASALSQWLAKAVFGNGDQHKTSALGPD